MSSPKSPSRQRGFAAAIKLTYRLMRIDSRRSARASFPLISEAATETTGGIKPAELRGSTFMPLLARSLLLVIAMYAGVGVGMAVTGDG